MSRGLEVPILVESELFYCVQLQTIVVIVVVVNFVVFLEQLFCLSTNFIHVNFV